ncbi:MAG: hypothetical protein AB7G48_15115 [Nitrospiraceae bacterium]
MHKALTVIEREGRTRSIAANNHLSLLDYEVAVIEPIKLSLHTFYVKNQGTQVHRVCFSQAESRRTR